MFNKLKLTKNKPFYQFFPKTKHLINKLKGIEK